MFLTDIHHATDLVQADATRTATWARRYETAIAARKGRGTRHIVGHALINLGRLIAAEPTPARAQVRVGR
jgi:hypothetical protein